MCGRFSLTTSIEILKDRFDLKTGFYMKPRYNIAPSQPIPVCKKKGEIDFLRWGFIPSFRRNKLQDHKNQNQPEFQGFINARSETINEKPAFKFAFEKQRCLILADGFYEWKSEARIKQPYFIRMLDKSPFGIAGIWQEDSCAILTKEANPRLALIHSRMPVILREDQYAEWLDPKTNIQRLLILLQDSEKLLNIEIFPVSTRVNHADFDGIECQLSLQ